MIEPEGRNLVPRLLTWMNRLLGRSSTPSNSDASSNNKLTRRQLNKTPSPSLGDHGLGPGTTSRTLALALAPSASPNHSVDLNGQRVYYRAHSYPQPPTRRELYWASRAIHSETLLAATTQHQYEIKELMRSRADELKQENDSRKARLEWLSLLLGAGVLILLLFYLFTPPRKSRRSINLILPNHFTIPILSPFTSVVETETSLFNTRTITLVLILAGIVTYGLLRHRINLSHKAK